MEIQIIPIHLSYSHSNFKSHALNFQAFLRHLPEYFNAAPRSDNFFLLELLFCQIPYSPTETPSATCAVTEEASLKLLCQFYFNVQIIAKGLDDFFFFFFFGPKYLREKYLQVNLG